MAGHLPSDHDIHRPPLHDGLVDLEPCVHALDL
jgi:hypothetical protein